MRKEKSGPFIAFVLLGSPEWDGTKCRSDLWEDWTITCPPDALSGRGDSLTFGMDGMVVAVRLIASRVPAGEAEYNAATNYLWPGAAEAASRHCAHLLVAVQGVGVEAMQVALLFAKVTSSCSRQAHTLGIYTSGTVFQPHFYRESAAVMKDGALPIFSWIHFGLYRTAAGCGGYTYGLHAFGMDELEVPGTAAEPADVRTFLFDIVYYVLSGPVVLHNGETIGFSAQQRLAITRSPGVALDGMTLKIEYPKD